MKHFSRLGWIFVAVSGAVLAAGSNRGFAQPISVFNDTTAYFAHNSQSYLGIDIHDIDNDRAAALKLKDPHGAEIVTVDHDAPANKAGLKIHDAILEMNGQRVEGSDQLRRMLRETPPGRTVSFVICRDGLMLNISVQLADRAKVLKALNTPKLGDSLLRADGTPWMTALAHSAPKLNWDDLAQVPALPLGSWLKTDPWDDRVHMLSAKVYAPMNPRDKMPLEVTPVYFKLQRYSAVGAPASAGSAADQPQNQPAEGPQGNQNNEPAPTATPGQSTPAAPPPSAAQPVAGDTAAQQQTPVPPQP